MTTGRLFVVSTPIGNLEDISLRALRILREVDLIAAEDTRRTARLLAHYGIPTRTISFHAHNIRSRLPSLLGRLRSGGSLALVTDAGTPGVSDPGPELVAACVREGIPVDPIPGASAFLAAAAVSGFPLVPLTFLGFAPRRAIELRRFIDNISEMTHTVVFYEAPHRMRSTLGMMRDRFGERPIMVARELTKRHQEILRGSAATLELPADDLKGEFTVVTGPPQLVVNQNDPAPTSAELLVEFCRMTNSAESRRQAVASLATRFKRPVREIYAALEAAKKR